MSSVLCVLCMSCNKTFSSVSNLKRHQNTSKSCNKNIIYKYECDHCEYKTSLKYNFNAHISTCKYKKEDEKIEIIQLKTEVKCLKEENKRLIKNPKIVNNNFNIQQNYFNNTLQPLQNIIPQLITCIQKELNYSTFLKGQVGLADLISPYLLNYYSSTENSGSTFWYKDENGNVKLDDNARLLVQKIYKTLLSTTNIYNVPINLNTDLNEQLKATQSHAEIKSIKSDSKKFRKKLATNVYTSTKNIKNNEINNIEECNDIKTICLEDHLTNENILKVLDKLFLSEINDSMCIIQIDPNMDNIERDYIQLDKVANYIIEKFLIVDGNLIYNYNPDNKVFYYNTKEGVQEDNDISTGLGQVWHLLRQRLMKMLHPEILQFHVNNITNFIIDGLLEIMI